MEIACVRCDCNYCVYKGVYVCVLFVCVRKCVCEQDLCRGVSAIEHWWNDAHDTLDSTLDLFTRSNRKIWLECECKVSL